MNMQQIIIELGIAVSYSLTYAYLLDIDQDSKEKIQWCGIGLVMMCMGINFVFTLIYLGKDIIERVKAYRNRNCRVEPDTKIDDSMKGKTMTNEPDTSTLQMNLDDSNDTSSLPIIIEDTIPHTYHHNTTQISTVDLENTFFVKLNRRNNLK